MEKEQSYVLIGEPIATCRAQSAKKRVWDVHQKRKTIQRVSLENQHGARPPYKGPLRLEVTFLFEPQPPSVYREDIYQHIPRSYMDRLLNFIFEIGTGILFLNDRHIIEIDAKKGYSVAPSTTFSIKQLHRK